jgi:hypothetical protein
VPPSPSGVPSAASVPVPRKLCTTLKEDGSFFFTRHTVPL